jgi:hypothetical protein
LNIVAYLLEAIKTAEPEKQPLLVNGSEKKHFFLRNGRKTDNGTTSFAR